MEENISFHGSELREASGYSRFVQEVMSGDFAILGFSNSPADHIFNQIHLTDNILEGSDIGVRNTEARADVAESGEILKQMIGKLVRCSLGDNALKFFRFDIAIMVLVEEEKCLTNAFSLQTAKHLRELWVCHRVTVLLAAQIKRCPVAIPVEGKCVACFIASVYLLEGIEINQACRRIGEETKCYIVLGVRLGEQMVEYYPVLKGDTVCIAAVGDWEEDGILFSRDLVLIQWSVSIRQESSQTTSTVRRKRDFVGRCECECWYTRGRMSENTRKHKRMRRYTGCAGFALWIGNLGKMRARVCGRVDTRNRGPEAPQH